VYGRAVYDQVHEVRGEGDCRSRGYGGVYFQYLLLVSPVFSTPQCRNAKVFRCVNVGALSGIATTFIEKDVGFWAAYLMPTAVFAVGIVIFHLNRHHYGLPFLIAQEPNIADTTKSINDRRGRMSCPLLSERCGTAPKAAGKWKLPSPKMCYTSTANPYRGALLSSKSSKADLQPLAPCKAVQIIFAVFHRSLIVLTLASHS